MIFAIVYRDSKKNADPRTDAQIRAHSVQTNTVATAAEATAPPSPHGVPYRWAALTTSLNSRRPLYAAMASWGFTFENR